MTAPTRLDDLVDDLATVLASAQGIAAVDGPAWLACRADAARILAAYDVVPRAVRATRFDATQIRNDCAVVEAVALALYRAEGERGPWSTLGRAIYMRRVARVLEALDTVLKADGAAPPE